ncbi:hypothetical protein B0H19DRAFT_1064129 [Mycena capillaripes]|nr:hypothetical protein B0H19DRAFT_1064129 [Mycena capillaripes]
MTGMRSERSDTDILIESGVPTPPTYLTGTKRQPQRPNPWDNGQQRERLSVSEPATEINEVMEDLQNNRFEDERKINAVHGKDNDALVGSEEVAQRLGKVWRRHFNSNLKEGRNGRNFKEGVLTAEKVHGEKSTQHSRFPELCSGPIQLYWILLVCGGSGFGPESVRYAVKLGKERKMRSYRYFVIPPEFAPCGFRATKHDVATVKGHFWCRWSRRVTKERGNVTLFGSVPLNVKRSLNFADASADLSTSFLHPCLLPPSGALPSSRFSLYSPPDLRPAAPRHPSMVSRTHKSKSPAFEPLRARISRPLPLANHVSLARRFRPQDRDQAVCGPPGGDRWEAVAGSALPVHREGSLARCGHLTTRAHSIDRWKDRKMAWIEWELRVVARRAGFGCHLTSFPPRRSRPIFHHTRCVKAPDRIHK